MSVFTTQIRFILESGVTDIGLNDYPIFDESYRAGLNKKIIDHYYFREIGFETLGLFTKFMTRKMNEIMPYYNQLYLSAQLEFDPFKTYDFTETNESSAKSLYNDTPMGSITDPYSPDYATDTTTATQSSTRVMSGKNDAKSYSMLLEEFRKTRLNIDMDVINDLEGLFMSLWEGDGVE